MQHWEELSFSLAEFAATLGQAPSETALQQRYLDGIGRYLPGLGAAIYLLAPDTGEVLDVSAQGVSDYFIARYERVGRTTDAVFQGVLANRRSVYNRDLMSMDDWKASDCYRDVLHLHRVDNSIQTPILLDGEIAGILNFARHEEQGEFGALERTLADTMGRVVGTAVLSVRERQHALRRCDRLQAALELVGQPVVVTDLSTAERFSNSAARALIDRLTAADTSLDDLIAQPGSNDGDVVGHELPLALDGEGEGEGVAMLRTRTIRPAEGMEVSFLDLTRHGEQPRTTSLSEPLTPREREVAQLAANGLGDQEIADRLFLSRHTVKGYLKACYRKLGINSRVALARLPHV